MPEFELIYFSPGGGSRKLARRVAETLCLSGELVQWDVTLPADRLLFFQTEHRGEHLFLVLPVYAQGLPRTVRQLLVKGRLFFPKATLLLTYGGVSPGSAVAQARALLGKKGVPLVSAMTVPAPHSYRPEIPAAAELSDEALSLFVGRSLQRNRSLSRAEAGRPLTVGRMFPQRLLAHLAVAEPRTNERCSRCGACARICPQGAIEEDERINGDLCVRCAACVQHCPNGGRTLRLRFGVTRRYLERHMARPQEVRCYF